MAALSSSALLLLLHPSSASSSSSFSSSSSSSSSLSIRPLSSIAKPSLCDRFFCAVQPYLHPNHKSSSSAAASFSSSSLSAHGRFNVWNRKLGFRILATPDAAEAEGSSETQPIKDFLQEAKSVGRIRIIVNTGAGILESVTSLDKLFYHTVAGRGEYANLMNKDENVDFHLALNKIKSVRFAKGKSMTGDIPTYMMRIMDVDDKAAALLLVMWKPDTKGEYDPGQVEAFESLLAKYGDTHHFR